MKITGQVISCAENGQIIIETTDGRRVKMPRMSASRQLGNGNVEFESIFAEELRQDRGKNE